MEAVSSECGDFAQRPANGVIVSWVRFAVLFSVLALVVPSAADRAGAVPAGAKSAASSELTDEFQAGVDAYRLGKYDDARVHLERVLVLDPKLPGPHRFLAAVASARQRWTECIAQARQAIALNPRSREIADTRKLHEDCRSQLGRPAYRAELGESAAIAVVSNVPGAMVRIGGLRYGGTPVAPRRIRPGAHEVEVDKPGFRPAHRAVDALPGIVTDVEVELEPVREPPPPPPRRERATTSIH
jgi:tetratricopeptide (TPR) repeat protein